MVLIIVMSVMNGYRIELLSGILDFNGHMFVTGQVLEGHPAACSPGGAARRLCLAWSRSPR